MSKSRMKRIAIQTGMSVTDSNAIPLTVQMLHQRVYKNVLQRQRNVAGNADIELAVITLLDLNSVQYNVTVYGTSIDAAVVRVRHFSKLYDGIAAYNEERGL